MKRHHVASRVAWVAAFVVLASSAGWLGAAPPIRRPLDPAGGEVHKKIVDSYMAHEWEDLAMLLKRDYPRNMSKMTREQRLDCLYIKKAAVGHRPAWWKNSIFRLDK